MRLIEELREQRFDDHRFYHHSRVNQSLHLVSALSFLTAFAFLPVNPVIAAMLGWIVAMCSRQIGHFFFEPKDYDDVNAVSHDYKEQIKIGYNLQRKVILLSIWGAIPVVLAFAPGFFGLLAPYEGVYGFLYNLSVLWICLGGAALIFRTVQLFFIRSPLTGIGWLLKILTDPFHDVVLYHKAPLKLLQGEWIDPMREVRGEAETDEEAYDPYADESEWATAT